MMYRVGVRDHVMIAHSFRGELFGPAQRLHGATYLIDVELCSDGLDENGVVVDIGLAHEALKHALTDLRYRNLDELPELSGKNTTTEFVAQLVWQRMAKALRAGELGDDSASRVHTLKVTLHESHVAWASYEAAVS